MTDFGDPVAVTPDAMPAPTARGGRQSNEPALMAWLTKVDAAAPGTYELASKDGDKAHPVSRGTQLRAIVNPVDENKQPLPSPFPNLSIETRAVTPGKRYRIFATRANATANAAKAPGKK